MTINAKIYIAVNSDGYVAVSTSSSTSAMERLQWEEDAETSACDVYELNLTFKEPKPKIIRVSGVLEETDAPINIVIED